MPSILKQLIEQSLFLDIQDTTGNPLTGLAFNSAGLSASFMSERDGAVTNVSLIELLSPSDLWVGGGFIEVDAVNMPGVYRFDIPDAAFLSRDRVVIVLLGAVNMKQRTEIFELLDIEPKIEQAVLTALQTFNVDGTYTLVDYLLIMGGALAGKLSGAAGTTITIRDILDTFDVLEATVDADGNRTAVTIYPP